MLDRSFGPSLLATLFALVSPAAAVPLDITDTASRPVEIAIESSSNLAVVGQTFGPAFPATVLRRLPRLRRTPKSISIN